MSAAAATHVRLASARPVLFVRAEDPPDPLLATIPTAYIRGKRVLHLFSGGGDVSVFISEHMQPMHVLGLEPDAHLVRRARGLLGERAAALALAAGLRPGIDLKLDPAFSGEEGAGPLGASRGGLRAFSIAGKTSSADAPSGRVGSES